MKHFFKPPMLIIASFLLITTCLMVFIGPEMVQSRYYDIRNDKANNIGENGTAEPVQTSYEKKGQMGDSFGGTIGPVIAWIAAVLTFAAFYIQYESNRTQRKQFKKQAKDTAVERFENNYFELISLHRQNVAETYLGENTGKRIFVLMIREFREILKIARFAASSTNSALSKEDLFKASYYGLFFGTGPNSSRMLHEMIEEFPQNFKSDFVKLLESNSQKKQIKARRNFNYTPFEGHQSRLGHYYRHLYQSVCYVHKKDLDIDKYAYVKILRAQLTTHEQALLFLNALSKMGKKWFDEKLLVEYKLVKNIPPKFFDPYTEINISEYFPRGYFEHEED